ncbi:hypothetical protein AOLI_G00086460 [Acnodon oligacanthus]
MRRLKMSKVGGNGRGYGTSPTPLTNQRDPCPFPRERKDEVSSCRAGGRVLLHQERGYRGATGGLQGATTSELTAHAVSLAGRVKIHSALRTDGVLTRSQTRARREAALAPPVIPGEVDAARRTSLLFFERGRSSE